MSTPSMPPGGRPPGYAVRGLLDRLSPRQRQYALLAAILGGGIGLLAFPVAALSLGMVVALTALEFLVAFLQAFVFAVLASIYLNDVVNLGHGH